MNVLAFIRDKFNHTKHKDSRIKRLLDWLNEVGKFNISCPAEILITVKFEIKTIQIENWCIIWIMRLPFRFPTIP